jgi:7SK snRNA methylphosphate capping enzyme
MLDAAATLTHNQRKKLRQKRSRLVKRGASEAAPAPAAQDEPAAKRQAAAAPPPPPASASGAASARGAASAEPRQRTAQMSLSSVQDADLHAVPAAAPAAAAQPAGPCRRDLTAAALLLRAGLRGGAAPAGAPAPPPEGAASAEDAAGSALAPARAGGGDTGASPARAPRAPAPTAAHSPSTAGAATGAAARAALAAPYGNYLRYYGVRLGPVADAAGAAGGARGGADDPRLALLERGWFARRRCLDVGCNEGVVTLALAARHGARSMVGVDVDARLVSRACARLRDARRAAAARAAAASAPGAPPGERRAARAAARALAATWFVAGDILSARGDPGSVDTLTALSVVKWIHLHGGDGGLRAFFARVRELLAPGGLFVLEPQPWSSYRAAAAKVRRGGAAAAAFPAAYFHRHEELALRPEGFEALLMEEFGFRLVRRLAPPAGAAGGFDRPLLLFAAPPRARPAAPGAAL